MNGVFIDSNVFIGILEGEERAKKALELDVGLYKNSVVSSEVVYVYLKALTDKKSYELKKKPEEIIGTDLDNLKDLLHLAETLPITKEIEESSFAIIERYGLLPNDALIAATCKFYGIKDIATFDKDFERVEFLSILEL